MTVMAGWLALECIRAALVAGNLTKVCFVYGINAETGSQL